MKSVLRSAAASLMALLLSTLPAAAGAQGGTISGRVIDPRTDGPAADALVSAQSEGRVVASVRSGTDGSYRLSNLEPGLYTVTAAKIGFNPASATGLRLAAGQSLTAELRLDAQSVILNPTVTTASRRPETALDAPAAVSVVSENEIRVRVTPTVADHVMTLPGVAVNKGGMLQSNIVSRGFNNAFSGTMLMLQDYRFAGVPSLRVNVPALFTSTPEDIERVEVLLGPASALYGPNATSGVLHVITKSPFTSQGTSITLDGGTRSYARASVRHARTFGEKIGVKGSFEQFYAKDWEFFDPAEPTTITRGGASVANVRDFGTRRQAGELRLDLRPIDKLEATTTFGMARLGSGLELTAANGTGQARNWNYTSLQQRVRYGRLFANVFLNSSDAGNDDSTDTEGTFLLRSGQPIVDQSQLFAAQIQHGFAPMSRLDLSYGLDLIQTTPKTGNTINGRNEDDDNMREIGGYLQATANLTPKLDLIGAARADQNDRVEGTQFSPRAALVFKPTPTQNVRLTFNRAFASPSNFSMFLDLVRLRVAPYTITAVGNPPKTGWQFERSCDASISGGLCMKSPFTGSTAFMNADATLALPGLLAAQRSLLIAQFTPTVRSLLLARGLPPSVVDAPSGQGSAASTTAALADQLIALRPTNAQITSRIAKPQIDPLTTNRDPSTITDITPLRPSYNNTWELGYKGIIGNRLRVAVNGWTEKRGEVGAPSDLATPAVYADSTTMAGYYTAALTQMLQAAQLGGPSAPAVAAGAAQTIANLLKAAPLGIITFNDPDFATPTNIYATYYTTNQTVTVQGADLAVDFVATDRINLSGSLSWVSDLIFEDVNSSNNLPLMLNAPDKRGSLAATFHDDRRGLTLGARGRYFNGYPVNSGVYATDFTFNAGTPAAYSYDDVETSTVFDATMSFRLPLGARFRSAQWSLNVDNIFNQPYRTFAGVPAIGRLITTRIRYDF